MSMYECQYCKIKFDNINTKPIILTCNDIICSSCINFKEKVFNNKIFECPVCMNQVSSTNIIFKPLLKEYDNINEKNNEKNNEFPIIIQFNGRHKIQLLVTKDMTIKQLREKIAEKENININNIYLAYKRPLNNDKTLEFYGITKTVVITMISIVIVG